MNRRFGIAATLLAAIALSGCTMGGSKTLSFAGKLNGAAEVPPKTTAGTGDAVATLDDDTGVLALFVVNRHPTESIDLTIDLRSWSEELNLREAVIVNDTIATDATSTAANTISRILVTGISAKGASDTLTATWNHDLLGGP